jgi:hypothetical protein
MNKTIFSVVKNNLIKFGFVILLAGIILPFFMLDIVQSIGFRSYIESDSIEWLSIPLMILAALVTISIWSRLIYLGIRKKHSKEMMRSVTVLGSFFVWFVFVLIKNEYYSSNSVYFTLQYAGYFVLIFSLFALWRVVLLHTGGHLRSILKTSQYRRLFIGIIGVYGLFYLFASGMFLLPNSEKLPSSTNGFIQTYESYGLLTSWPNMEFWWPAVSLAGSVSLDALLLFITITGFMAISMTLLIYGWRSSSNRNFGIKGVSSTVGSGMAVTFVSFSCCSLPLLYPLLLLFLSTAAAESMAALMVHEAGLLFNLMQMAILSLMAVMVIFMATRLERVNVTCKVGSTN